MLRLALILALTCGAFVTAPARAQGDGGTCFICKKSSTKECVEAVFCRSASGKDTPDDRRRCRNLGCEIGGTATCKVRENMPICGDDTDARWGGRGEIGARWAFTPRFQARCRSQRDQDRQVRAEDPVVGEREARGVIEI